MCHFLLGFTVINLCLGLSYEGNAPKLKPFAFDKNVISGQRARVFCQLLEGSTPLSFRWSKDGHQLKSLATESVGSIGVAVIEDHEDYSSLVIDPVSGKSSGNYTCLVSNSYGSDTYSNVLMVEEPPVFEKEPDNVSVGLSRSILLTCKANGFPKPIIVWNKIKYNKGLENDAKKEFIGSGETLRLPSVNIEDAGIYECIAENPINNLAINKVFTITVNVPAYFELKSSHIEIKRSDTAKLVCEAFGAKPITITWYRQHSDGNLAAIPLEPSSDSFPRFTTFEKNFDDNIANKTIFELHINSVDSRDSGQYMCKAANPFGDDVRTINLFVQDVPSIPQNVRIDQRWSRDVSISWSAPNSNGNSQIINYIIQYWKDNATSSAAHRLYEEEISAAFTSNVMRNKLTPGTSYAIRVLATNEFGRGLPSATVKFSTHEEEPDSPPIDIIVETKGTSSLRIKWKAPPKSHWNGQLKGYYLGFKMIATDDVKTIESNRFSFKEIPFTGVQNDNYQEEFELTGLQKSTLYSIVIKAFNSAGEGPSSQEIITSTSNNDPPSRPSVWISSTTETSIALKWDQKGITSDITHYVIYYKDDRSPWMEIAFPSQETSQYELSNLQRGTVYQLYMRAMSKRGSSDPSDVLTIRTEGDVAVINIVNNEGVVQQEVPPYLRSSVIIPISVAIVIIVIACSAAYAYIKIEERNAQILKAGMISVSPSKNFQYINTTSPHVSGRQSVVSEEGTLSFRYSDSSDKTKPLLARPPIPTVLWAQHQEPILEESDDYPSPYATLPFQKFTSFKSPPSSQPPPLPPENRRYIHDDKNLIYHTPPHTSSSNVFCKVDVHNQDNSDSYDEFFKPHHV